MFFKREESVISKRINVLEESIIGGKSFKRETYQKFLRTTYKFLFIPIYTYDKRI